MEFYRVLQSIMDEKGLTIPEVARLCGLSDSTVRTVLTRKSKSVSLEVAFKLSSGLGVSLDRLNYGSPEVKKATPKCNDLLGTLTGKEIELVFAYRQASEDDQAVVDAALRKYRDCLSNSKGDAEKMA